MKPLPFLTLFIILFSGLWVAGCSGTSKSTDNAARPAKKDGIKTDNPALSLSDYLRRVPGVRVSGTGDHIRVTIAGQSFTGTGEAQPLFVIDNTPVGTNYQSVESLVSVSDIDRVKVLKGNEASTVYGFRAAAGAIIIKTKKQN
ncbi:MAG: hypothetical protein D6714_13820 [Bacteroidetes bacterium]|nr:MAG: hypothetical protein D6714_13820 [Bacteroidota bacterium]